MLLSPLMQMSDCGTSKRVYTIGATVFLVNFPRRLCRGLRFARLPLLYDVGKEMCDIRFCIRCHAVWDMNSPLNLLSERCDDIWILGTSLAWLGTFIAA